MTLRCCDYEGSHRPSFDEILTTLNDILKNDLPLNDDDKQAAINLRDCLLNTNPVNAPQKLIKSQGLRALGSNGKLNQMFPKEVLKLRPEKEEKNEGKEWKNSIESYRRLTITEKEKDKDQLESDIESGTQSDSSLLNTEECCLSRENSSNSNPASESVFDVKKQLQKHRQKSKTEGAALDHLVMAFETAHKEGEEREIDRLRVREKHGLIEIGAAKKQKMKHRQISNNELSSDESGAEKILSAQNSEQDLGYREIGMQDKQLSEKKKLRKKLRRSVSNEETRVQEPPLREKRGFSNGEIESFADLNFISLKEAAESAVMEVEAGAHVQESKAERKLESGPSSTKRIQRPGDGGSRSKERERKEKKEKDEETREWPEKRTKSSLKDKKASAETTVEDKTINENQETNNERSDANKLYRDKSKDDVKKTRPGKRCSQTEGEMDHIKADKQEERAKEKKKKEYERAELEKREKQKEEKEKATKEKKRETKKSKDKKKEDKEESSPDDQRGAWPLTTTTTTAKEKRGTTILQLTQNTTSSINASKEKHAAAAATGGGGGGGPTQALTTTTSLTVAAATTTTTASGTTNKGGGSQAGRSVNVKNLIELFQSSDNIDKVRGREKNGAGAAGERDKDPHPHPHHQQPRK